MDIQKLIDAMSEAGRRARKDYHLTLGGLIAALEGAGDTPVRFDRGGSPTKPHSYRGYYSDLCFESTDKPVKASRLLEGARTSVGRTFEGYKGGDFTMGEDTPLWVAPYGCTGDAITGAELRDGAIVLTTRPIR